MRRVVDMLRAVAGFVARLILPRMLLLLMDCCLHCHTPMAAFASYYGWRCCRFLRHLPLACQATCALDAAVFAMPHTTFCRFRHYLNGGQAVADNEHVSCRYAIRHAAFATP